MIRLLLVVGFLLTISAGVAQTVYKTPSGEKYHTTTSRYVKNVSSKLTVAEARRRGGLIFHSDRGIQYACDEFRKVPSYK